MIAKNPAISKLIMRHINYYDDYQRLLERLAENYSGNAAQAIRHWNEQMMTAGGRKSRKASIRL